MRKKSSYLKVLGRNQSDQQIMENHSISDRNSPNQTFLLHWMHANQENINFLMDLKFSENCQIKCLKIQVRVA